MVCDIAMKGGCGKDTQGFAKPPRQGCAQRQCLRIGPPFATQHRDAVAAVKTTPEPENHQITGAGSAIRGITSSQKGVGVQGWADAKKGNTVGVEGKTVSPKGVAGQFVAGRGGTAILGKSPDRNGVALRTEGKLQFAKRSGDATTSGGAEFVIPVAGGLNDNSLVLATLQDHHPGVHVEAASVLDTSNGNETILVRLNQAVPEPTRVAWLILD